MDKKNSETSEQSSASTGVKDRYQGAIATVVHCQGALDSFHEALGHVNKKRAKSLTTRMILQIQRLAEQGPGARSDPGLLLGIANA